MLKMIAKYGSDVHTFEDNKLSRFGHIEFSKILMVQISLFLIIRSRSFMFKIMQAAYVLAKF